MRLQTQVILILSIMLFALPLVDAKSYSLQKADILMTVNNDSSISVQETISYRFRGSFTYAYRDIDLKNEQISDINVYESRDGFLVQLPYKISQTGSGKRVTWYYNASYESKEF